MRPIVCATRGGEASRRTQERAVALAKERGAKLIFLYVVDRGFAGPVSEALADALEDELKRLGTSLLHIAQARAREQGVEAETAVRFGPVWETIGEYLRRVGAGTLVVGAARGGTREETEAAAQWIRRLEESGVEVVVVS